MKIKLIHIIRTLLIAVCVLLLSNTTVKAETRYRVCVAYVVDVYNDIITMETNDGNLWQILDDTFRHNDMCVLVIDNATTATVEDDIIIDVIK